jgi:hypothetical protein
MSTVNGLRSTVCGILTEDSGPQTVDLYNISIATADKFR